MPLPPPLLPLQSEYGDLYRVSLDCEGEQVKGEWQGGSGVAVGG